MVDQFRLIQHQLEVTRHASGNTLDLVLCSNLNLVKSVEVIPGMSDHLAVLTTLVVQPKPYIKKPHKVLLYRTADFDGLRRDMSDFSQLFLSPGMDSHIQNVDGSWQCFKDALTFAIKKHIPMRNSQVET